MCSIGTYRCVRKGAIEGFERVAFRLFEREAFEVFDWGAEFDALVQVNASLVG